MTSFSSLRVRLVGTVFLAVVPAGVLMYFADKYYSSHYNADLPWTGFFVGLVALAAAWFGGELVDRLAVGVDEGANLNTPSSLTGQPAAQEVRYDESQNS